MERGNSHRVTAGARRILFLPLGNVLGHLTRTLALAEEFHSAGHEVFIAANDTFPHITRVLPGGIRLLGTPGMYKRASEDSGPITHYCGGLAQDRANLKNAGRLAQPEQWRRARRLTQMIERDKTILAEVRPHAVITDYRFTTQLLRQDMPAPVFHISNILGYPSLCRRVSGSFPFPLDRGHILVPGVRDIEYWRRRPASPAAGRRETFCGAFRWQGWRRLSGDSRQPPRSDVFLFFGSTGNARKIAPWMLREIPDRYRITCIGSGVAQPAGRDNIHVASAGDLETFLENTRVAFCHGGHGTIMECIWSRTPMVIFPHNLEQLEIGARIEKMGMGVLVKQPYDKLNSQAIASLIERAGTDSRIRANLERYSGRLRQHNGARQAVETVLRHLEHGDLAA